MYLTTSSSHIRITTLAESLYPLVFRRDFAAPGAALLTFEDAVPLRDLRRLMVELKESLAGTFRRETGRHLVYRSLARFDQQVTTRFHLDGAPPESYLMLGYEPSEVPSAVAIADYTRAARDWGISPTQLLADFNPMFGPHEKRLLPYVTTLARFDPSRSQILLVNNSSLPFEEGASNSLGVMHQATILTEMPGKSRVINSTMLAPALDAGEETAGREAQATFVETQAVAGYLGQASSR